MTRLADRLVISGHVTRGRDPRHRGVVTLALTPSGEDLVARVLQWRRDELSRILGRVAPADREAATRVLRLLVEAAGEGYGSVRHRLVLL